jgi:hypothetical protein
VPVGVLVTAPASEVASWVAPARPAVAAVLALETIELTLSPPASLATAAQIWGKRLAASAGRRELSG